MAASLPDVAPALPIGGLGPAGLAFPRSRSRLRLKGMLDLYVPLAVFVLMLLACFIAPLILPIPDPTRGSIVQATLPPFSPGHLLGTDPLGNDLLSRALYGGRVSFEVGFGAQGVGLVLGGGLGMIAGLKGGRVESIVMRVMDMLLAFPNLVIAITIASYLGPSEVHVIWAISFFTVPGMCRLARAQTLRLRDRDFVVSSGLFGMHDRWIMLSHLVPNVVPSLLNFQAIGIGIAIVAEAGLSFLGLGVPPPAPSWGNMISQGQTYIAVAPYLVIVPGVFLFITVMSLNLLADAIRAHISRG